MTHPIDSWGRITPGSIVRFLGGGPYFVSEGKKHRLTLPGLFRVRAIIQKRTCTYLEVFGLDKVGGTYTVFVEGKPYKSKSGLRMRPYKVRRPRKVRLRCSN